MNVKIELECEEDGRWIAEVPDLPGVIAYGKDRDDAIAHVQALALRFLVDRLEHGEAAPSLLSVTFKAASAPGPPSRRGAFSLLSYELVGRSSVKPVLIESLLEAGGARWCEEFRLYPDEPHQP